MSVTEFVTWELNVLYPCTNGDLITISGNAPEQQSYPLFTESQIAPFSFQHEKFVIALQGSNDNTICGGLTYEASLDETPLSESPYPPVSYLTFNQEFFVFSEDQDFAGLKILTVNAYMTDYDMHTHQISIELLIYNPCPLNSFVQISGVAPHQ